MVKEFFKSLFGASGKEVSGLAVLILVLLIGFLVPKVMSKFSNRAINNFPEDKRMLDSLVVILAERQQKPNQQTSQQIRPHKFNPNNVDYEELITLGFNDIISKRIVNYRNKGGTFYHKSDLYKIYGIDSNLVNQLFSYIELPVTKVNIHTPKNELVNTSTHKVKGSIKEIELPDFDINIADTAMLQTIKGIGSVFAKRIVNYRESLGGFISKSQLFEVYNLDSAVISRLYDKIYLDSSLHVKRIFINRAKVTELAQHPYISWQQAKLLVAYRNQHGDFKTTRDLVKVYGIEEKDIKRIAPYIDCSPTN